MQWILVLVMPLTLEANGVVQNIYCQEDVSEPSVSVDVQLSEPINPISRDEQTNLSARMTLTFLKGVLVAQSLVRTFNIEDDIYVIKRGKSNDYKIKIVWGAMGRAEVNLLEIVPVVSRSRILKVDMYSGEYLGGMDIANIQQNSLVQRVALTVPLACTTDDGKNKEE